MKSSVSNLIKEHNKILEKAVFDEDFLAFHLRQIKFLQHERVIHLLVTLFVSFCLIVFLCLFLVLNLCLLLVPFSLFLIMTVLYIFHYFKLENTVIKWYFIYNKNKLHKL